MKETDGELFQKIVAMRCRTLEPSAQRSLNVRWKEIPVEDEFSFALYARNVRIAQFPINVTVAEEFGSVMRRGTNTRNTTTARFQ